MAGFTYLLVIAIFVLYYMLVLMIERRMITDPTEIIEKFLAVLLAYAGISLIYFSFTGRPFFGDDVSEYYVYIFIIGFISVVWAIPNLLSEFKFFKKFTKQKKK